MFLKAMNAKRVELKMYIIGFAIKIINKVELSKIYAESLV